MLGAPLEQIISDGVFPADLHPGNIFITPEGTLGLLNFGSVGRLDPATQTALGMMLYPIDKSDAAGATDALIELLDRPENLVERALERPLGTLLTRFRTGFGPGGSQKMFGDLFALIIAHQFAVPAQIGAAQSFLRPPVPDGPVPAAHCWGVGWLRGHWSHPADHQQCRPELAREINL